MAESSDKSSALKTTTAMVVSVSILLSVVYETIFFHRLGVRLFSIISTQDFLGLLLRWLPITFSAVPFTFVFAALLIRGDATNNSASKALQSNARQDALRRTTHWLLIFLLVLVVAMVVTSFTYKPGFEATTVGILFATIWMLGDRFRHSLLIFMSAATYFGRPAALFIPPLIFVAAGAGFDEATNVLRYRNPEIVELHYRSPTDAAPREPETVTLVRALERGVVVAILEENSTWETPKIRVRFVRWDAIESLTSEHLTGDNLSFACRNFGAPCLGL